MLSLHALFVIFSKLVVQYDHINIFLSMQKINLIEYVVFKKRLDVNTCDLVKDETNQSVFDSGKTCQICKEFARVANPPFWGEKQINLSALCGSSGMILSLYI